jgi:Ca-activated chloride channel family protein
MSFGSPLTLLALLAIPAAAGIGVVAARRRGGAEIAFTNIGVLESVAPDRRRARRRFVPLALLLLALASAAAATAHPRVNLPVRVNDATIVLLVDVSGSMSARDVEPTRLDAAVAAMRGFIQRLPKGFEVGLVDFSTFPVVLAVPSANHESVNASLDQLTPTAGTAIGLGIATAVRLVQSSMAADHVVRVPGRPLPAAIVLLSDGKQNEGRVQPLQAALRAHADGIPIDTVALGTTRGVLGYGPFAKHVAPDPVLMKAIARSTGGRTATARNAGQLASFYRSVGSSFGSSTASRDVASWLGLGAGLLLVAAVALGRLWWPALA